MKYLLTALIAAASLVYCVYLLMQVPVTSGSLLTTLLQSTSKDVHLVAPVAGALVSILILVILAAKATRVVKDELHIDKAIRFITETSPRLKAMENRNNLAGSLLSNLRTLEPRLKALEDPENGLVVQEREARAEYRRLFKRVESLGMSGDEDLPDSVSQRFAGMVEKLEKLETLHRDLPKMVETVESFEVRVATLEHEEDGLIAQLESLRDTIDTLYDSNEEGAIADLEAGSPNSDYTLEEDIDYLSEKVGEVRDGLARLDEQAEKLSEIRKSLAELGVKPNGTAAPT